MFAISNVEIAKKVDILTKGYKSSISKLTMTMSNSTGAKSVRVISFKTKESKGSKKSLMEFLTPKDVSGTKFLSHESAKGTNQWLYLPALKRVKRIAGRGKSGSFMGSEFTYEDLGSQGIENFDYEDKVKEDSGQYIGIRVPKDKSSGYSKQIVYVDKSSFLVSKIEYYDKKNRLLKIAIFSDYKKSKNLYRVGKIEMRNVQTNKSTVIKWSEDKIFANLKDKDFNKRVLKK